jgi:hypothetical protein
MRMRVGLRCQAFGDAEAGFGVPADKAAEVASRPLPEFAPPRQIGWRQARGGR